MRKFLALMLAVVVVAGLVWGGVAGWRCVRDGRLKDVYARRFLFMPRRLTDAEWKVETATDRAEPVPCADILGPRTMVALILGQSNAANTVHARYTPRRAVYMYYDHVCYKAADPLPGASDPSGSTWTRLGDRLIAAGLYDKVLLVDRARSGSSILNWGRYGDLPFLFRGVLRDLTADGIRPTHVFFHQGEADCASAMSRRDYTIVLTSFLRQLRHALGRETPIFVCRASMYRKNACRDNADPACFATCPAVTRAQAAVVDPSRRIYAGPDTDRLVPYEQRPDGYHFSGRGADAFAAAWVPILARQQGR